MTERLREKAIEGAVYAVARDCQGVYPQTVQGGDKPYEKRTEWMEGWNAYGLALIQDAGKIFRWLESLGAQRIVVEELLLAGQISLYLNEASVSLYVDCSDTFFWGCSDAEEITVEELPSLIECYSLSPKYGGELWCCRKRGMRPQTASYKECYPKEEWHLFDAAGPKRDDPDGKGRP